MRDALEDYSAIACTEAREWYWRQCVLWALGALTEKPEFPAVLERANARLAAP